MNYKEALAASFARMYRASEDVINREAVDIGRRFPAETRADFERGIVGYRFEVYANIRDMLGASHEDAAACVLGALIGKDGREWRPQAKA